MTIILILFYLIGCVLAYGRLVASFYQIDEMYPMLPPSKTHWEAILSILSWVSFLAGLILYMQNRERYFIKWSKKELWDAYNKRFN